MSQQDFTSDSNIWITPKVFIPSVAISSNRCVDTRSTSSGTSWHYTFINSTSIVVVTGILDPASSASILLVTLSIKSCSLSSKRKWAFDHLVLTFDSVSFDGTAIQCALVIIIAFVLDDLTLSITVTLVLSTWRLYITLKVSLANWDEFAPKVVADSTLSFRIKVGWFTLNIRCTFGTAWIFSSSLTDEPFVVLATECSTGLVVDFTFIDVALVVEVGRLASWDVLTLLLAFSWILTANILGARILVITQSVCAARSTTNVCTQGDRFALSVVGTLVDGTRIFVVTFGSQALPWLTDVNIFAGVCDWITLSDNTLVVGGACSMCGTTRWWCGCLWCSGATRVGGGYTGTSFRVARGSYTRIVRLASCVTGLRAFGFVWHKVMFALVVRQTD